MKEIPSDNQPFISAIAQHRGVEQDFINAIAENNMVHEPLTVLDDALSPTVCSPSLAEVYMKKWNC